MSYTDDYFDKCTKVFLDLMDLKEVILFYRRNNRLFNLFGKHKPDPINEEGHTYYDFKDSFTETINKFEKQYYSLLEKNIPVRNSRDRRVIVLNTFGNIVIVFSKLVQSRVFQMEIENTIKRFQEEIKNRVKREDILEIMKYLKSELVSILEGYQEVAEPFQQTQVNIIRNVHEPFVTNTNDVYNIGSYNHSTHATYLVPNYQHEGFIPKGGEIYTVPAKNIHPVKVSLETRKRNSKTREKKMSRYFKVETRRRNLNAKKKATRSIKGTKF